MDPGFRRDDDKRKLAVSMAVRAGALVAFPAARGGKGGSRVAATYDPETGRMSDPLRLNRRCAWPAPELR
jgi:hypothetical protein